MKKIIKFMLIVLVSILSISLITIKAYELVTITKSDGSGERINHLFTTTPITIPDQYETQETDFRGVWVSALVNDVPTYQSKEQYMNAINSVFANMEKYNLNTMVFHIRMNNDAMYKSSLNPLASYMGTANFDEWDPLEWIISECHRRGFEFHAWMNPYRCTSSGVTNLTTYSNRFPSSNIASDESMLLLTDSGGVILNPGEARVRRFIINSCMEVIENYDVDAIHFDDYFYAEGIDDTATYNKYKANYPEATNIMDFRREQVNVFINDLHNEIGKYNKSNNKCVQLGVAPTGVYKNGVSYTTDYQYDENGTLISPTGSNTRGQEHFASYLYCDTKKWIDNEWIDYIIPQSYWSLEDVSSAYADVIDFWAAVCKYKNVNLYAGMGLYMTNDSTRKSWYTSPNEAYNQVRYASQYDTVQGHCIFSYRNIASSDSKLVSRLTNLKEKAWTNPAILPEYKNCTKVDVDQVANLKLSSLSSGNYLQWDIIDEARRYVVYRSEKEITYDASEVIGITGENLYFDDAESKNYNYAVRAMSMTNTLGEGTSVSVAGTTKSYVYEDYDGTVLYIGFENITPSNPEREGYRFTNWSSPVLDANGNEVYTPQYEHLTFTVVFKNQDGKIYDTQIVEYGEDCTRPSDPVEEGKIFKMWSGGFYQVKSDTEIYAVFDDITFIVQFYDEDGSFISEETVIYGTSADSPSIVEGFDNFRRWDTDFSKVYEDLVVTAIYYKEETIVLTFKVDDEVVETVKIDVGEKYTLPTIPEKEGYTGVWNIEDTSTLTENTQIEVVYLKNVLTVQFLDKDGNLLKEEKVNRGEDATSPDAPVVNGYTFDGWGNITNIQDDLVLTASYTKNSGCNSGVVISQIITIFTTFALIIVLRKK